MAHVVRGIVTALALQCMTAAAAAQDGRLRPFAVDDLFRIEELSGGGAAAAVFSPDGARVAFTRVRPKDSPGDHDQNIGARVRGDVWLAGADGAVPVNVTNGAASGGGYWAPIWSPDGGALAMFCYDGARYQVCTWSATIGVRRAGGHSVRGWGSAPVWLDAKTLLFAALPEGAVSRGITTLRRAPDVAMAAWPQVRVGEVPTASVLESGVSRNTARPAGALIRYDVSTGAERVLLNADVRDLRPAPSGDRIAALIAVRAVVPEPGMPYTYLPEQALYELRLVDSDGALPTPALEGVGTVVPGSFDWSADGTRLAFLAHPPADPRQVDLYVFSTGPGTLARYRTDGLGVPVAQPGFPPAPAPIWTGGGRLAARLRGPDGRLDWWLLDEHDAPRNVTASLAEPPANLVHEGASGALIGVGGGSLWRIGRDGGEPERVADATSPRIDALAWPRTREEAGRGVGEVLVRTGAGSGVQLLQRVQLRTGQFTRVAAPIGGEELIAYSESAGTLAFRTSDRNGTRLSLGSAGSARASTLFEANTFLREIADAETRLIEYRSSDGRDLAGWVLLPVGYREGERYPLVVRVYAGTVMGRTQPAGPTALNLAHPLNLQLLTARGYAVLLPSMPMPPEDGTPADPFLELTNGVLPAVEKVIELGIADPDRLAVMGQSMGGYSTLGLVAQTSRFRAAISLAGFANLISLYGQIPAQNRYEDSVQESFFFFGGFETGWGLMVSPPWSDVHRYLRNSPISYADRVRTPVLLIHGDLDFVAIQQAEEFFMALLRQNRRARFVRYWGEGHVLSSPANIRHMWTQIFDWLDELLATDATAGRTLRR